jgi:hypothetical protein
MSAREVLITTEDLLKDPAVGFVATLAALIAAAPPPVPGLRSETEITRKRPPGSMSPAHTPQLGITLQSASTAAVQMPHRDGRVGMAVRYECFEADEEKLEHQVAYAAAALSRVIVEHLREYSDTHGGTVVEIDNPLSFAFGEFDGPVSAGFVASLLITERSSE